MSKAESYEEMLEALADEMEHKIVSVKVRPRTAGGKEVCYVCRHVFRDGERLLSVIPAHTMVGGPYVICIDREACRARVIGAKHLADAQEVARRKAVVEAVNL